MRSGSGFLFDFQKLSLQFQSLLVGIEHGRYLILKAPEPVINQALEPSEIGELIVKSLYRGTIYAFRSRLINMISHPSKLMFIEYPGKIKHHELRSHKRFRCSVVAQARIDIEERGAVIENISKGGCRCIIETFSTDNNLSQSLVKGVVPFRCRFPGSKDEINFMGEVRNSRKKTG